MFRHYASGNATTASLAGWLNEQGFPTRNTKRLPDTDGTESTGARLFTNASVHNILHNACYAGFVKYKGDRLAGSHEPLIGTELFEAVQAALRKNSGVRPR